MVSLSGLNTIMNESADAVMYTGMDYMTESAFDQMINESLEALDESAKEEANAILKGKDMMEVKDLLKRAKKLRKYDPEESKKLAKQASAKLKALSKQAEKISDDDAAKAAAKAFIPQIVALAVVFGGNALVTAGIIPAVPAIVAGFLSLIPQLKSTHDTTMARIGQDAHSKPGEIIDFSKYTKNKTFAIIDQMIDTAEDLEKNRTFMDKFLGRKQD